MIAERQRATNKFNDDESRWQALVNRDRAADALFYYSVATTGVYCRPSCAARLAKRANVRFHRTCEQAERAGFRACKRCRPHEASLSEQQHDAVTRACRLIEAADAAPNLTELANTAGLSRFHFHRVFKSITGVTPKAYVAEHRYGQVKKKLRKGALVAEAIFNAGFSSNSRFYETATERLGMKPAAFRAGGAGTVIRFAVGACSLGSVLVAASDLGVCAIFLGDDRNALARELNDRFPKAQIVSGDAAFDRWIAETVALVEKPALGLTLPLDIRGTAFQLRVWEALRRIPPGSTASYVEVAARIGQPKAARAVANACAANPIAIAIPCHRVVHSDQLLSGYRWGVERKAVLLAREKLPG